MPLVIRDPTESHGATKYNLTRRHSESRSPASERPHRKCGRHAFSVGGSSVSVLSRSRSARACGAYRTETERQLQPRPDWHTHPKACASSVNWGAAPEHSESKYKLMRCLALATDYDGTLAHDGRVEEPTLHVLERLRRSGRKLVLVTGRELDDLLAVFPEPSRSPHFVTTNWSISSPSPVTWRIVRVLPLTLATVSEWTLEMNLCVNPCHESRSSCCSGL